MMELSQALAQLNIDKETLDAIVADGSDKKNELIGVLTHCLYKVPAVKDAAATLLQYIASSARRMDSAWDEWLEDNLEEFKDDGEQIAFKKFVNGQPDNDDPATIDLFYKAWRSRKDAADKDAKWITVHGAHIPLDDDGEMKGEVAEKIKETSKKVKDHVTESSAPSSDKDFENEGYKKNAEGHWQKSISSCKTRKDLEDALDERGLTLGDRITDKNAASVSRIMKPFDGLASDYPELGDHVKSINLEDGYNGGEYKDTEIIFAEEMIADEKDFEHTCKVHSKGGYWPKNSTPEGRGCHELAHGLERMIAFLDPKAANEAQSKYAFLEGDHAKAVVAKAIKAVRKNRPDAKPSELKTEISEYSKRSPSETLAEAFADCYDNGDKAADLSKAIKAEFDSLYRQFKDARGDGGPGSGNWGHEGRPGEVGGSKEGGGKHNRIEKENGTFTSFSKRQKKAATPHIISARELAKMPVGTKIIGYGDDVWEKLDDSYYINTSTGELESPGDIASNTIDYGTKLSLALPKSANKNFSIASEHEIQPEELDQPLGTKLHMNGKVYVQTMKNIWENPDDDDDFFLKSELKHGHKKGYFESPDGKVQKAPEKSSESSEKSGEKSGEAKHGKVIKSTMTESDLLSYPFGTQIKAADGTVYTKIDSDFWTASDKPEKWIFGDDTAEKITSAGGASEILNPNEIAAKQNSKSIGSGIGCSHPDECFTAERRSKAIMHKTSRDADDMFRAKSGEVWQQCDKTTKRGFESYTSGGYRTINPFLRGEIHDINDEKMEHIRGMTEAIDKCEFEHDVVLPRGSGRGSISTMLGCKKGDLYDPDFLANLTGREMRDDGFLSCGSSQNSGFDKACRLEIYCPKGTKGIYAEPFSSCGAGDHINWDGRREDGKSKQSWFSAEDETILQRGTTLRITKAYFDQDLGGTGKTVIQCEVIRQEPDDI